MPRRRDRGFLDALELLSPRTAPPQTTPTAFVTIAHTFEQIDRVMLAETRADRDRRSTSRFRFSLENNPDGDVASYIQNIQQGTSHTLSDAHVFAYLSDCQCMIAWDWVHGAVLEHQGDSHMNMNVAWVQAKFRANEILDLASAVLEAYDSNECQDLLVPGREGVRPGIEAKLRKLASFNTIYCRPSYEEQRSNTGPGNHTYCALLNQFFAERMENTKTKRKANYIRAHQNVSKRSA